MRVRFVASDTTGGGYCRSFWPAEHLKAQEGFHARAEVWWPKRDEYDVVVMHRPLQRDYVRRVRRYQDAGLRVLIDEDDDLYRVPPDNVEAHAILTGNGALAQHEAAVELADGVTVTTPALQAQYEAFGKRVFLCPNALPIRMSVHQFHRPRDPRVLVSWAGIVKTHRQDLEWLQPAMELLMRDAHLVTIGDDQTAGVLGVRAAEVFKFQMDMNALYSYMAYSDIGIVPLVPIEFNVAKSYLKALEYSQLAKPVVVTNLPEQQKVVEHGVTGFLADTPQEFAEYVQLLVHDRQMREEMGAAAKIKARSLAIEHTTYWQDALHAIENVDRAA